MSAPQSTKSQAAVSTNGLPDALKTTRPVWEARSAQTPTKPASITRLYQNGQLFTWSNTRRMQRDGKPSREAAPYAWRLDAQVSPAGVERVCALIRSGFVTLSPSGALHTGMDQGTITYVSYLDGKDHELTVPTSATAKLPQVVQDIDDAIRRNIVPGGAPHEQ